ncbi:tRNA(fMet)-specific endonuclease VapC [Thioalkalivibrio sp. XN8]|uniref:type II toxin-antitoxin system tRNA(fMet)-specific endonuclease VapC n=1 Tax=Thioalkalivibrio sp. XN8 TaxID=2712863 RepID=UPI0013EA311C|nr:tRNA(fMet)-specific endonuclease VapC [Thioalkalivibrio sp. XN8]NGP53770.1 type II toxin-antitoxin system VapC family toxin [Thioalkalivibrio sp. XN8]
MLRYMLDTDSCVFVLRHQHPALQDRLDQHAESLSISSVVLSELHFGVEHSARPEANRRVLESFAARLVVLPFDAPAAFHSGRVRAELRRAGQAIGAYDLMIAGHARSAGLALVTNNEREFRRVPGLMVESWL